jgi:hypothetical protein
MSSQRRKIREAVTDLLKGKTVCEDRVFKFRTRSLFEHELPAILVYTKAEPARVFTTAPVEYERNLHLIVEIVAKADESLDDVLDDIADEVEYWMHQDHTKGELCADTILKSTEIAILNPGDTMIGSAVLNFEMPYYTEAVADPLQLRVLAKADIKYHLFSDDDAASGNQAEDLIYPATGDL